MATLCEDILAMDDLTLEPLVIPEWKNKKVWIRTMEGDERDAFEANHVKDPSKSFRARLAVATVCDEKGNALFTQKDVSAVGRKSAAALDRILDVASRLNGMSQKDVEELEKNSK